MVSGEFRGQAGAMGEKAVPGDCRTARFCQSVTSFGEISKGINAPVEAAALLVPADWSKK
jgi:hypothetical protein